MFGDARWEGFGGRAPAYNPAASSSTAEPAAAAALLPEDP